MSSDLKVVLKRTVRASAKTCFDAWLDPETIKSFMSGCDGIKVEAAQVDRKVGGAFLIVMKVGGEEKPHRGHYKVIKPYEQLAFTWLSVHQTLPDSTVTLDFKAIDAATTEVTLTHVGFVSEGARKGHEGGWTTIVGGFVDFFAR